MKIELDKFLNDSRTFYRTITCIAFAILASAGQAAADDKKHQVEALRVETLADNIEAGSGGVAIDAAGNVYTADFGSRLGRGGEGGHRVYKIKPGGEVNLFAQGFRGASGNCFDANGNLFQSNIGGSFISKVTPQGQVSKFSTGGYANPVGIVPDQQGNLFVCNCGNGAIRKTTKDGQSTEFVKSPLLKCPNGITIDRNGNLYTANFYNGDVIKITPDAEVSKLATIPGNNNGHLTFHGNSLFVIARSAHQIYRVTLDGDISLFAGSGERGKADGKPLESTFSLPNDIGVSPDGKYMYVNEVSPITGSPQILAPTRVRRIVLRDHQ